MLMKGRTQISPSCGYVMAILTKPRCPLFWKDSRYPSLVMRYFAIPDRRLQSASNGHGCMY